MPQTRIDSGDASIYPEERATELVPRSIEFAMMYLARAAEMGNGVC